MKKLLVSVVMLTALVSVNAQTRVATIQGDDGFFAIPAAFSHSGATQLCIINSDGVAVYNANLQLQRNIAIEEEEINLGQYGEQYRFSVGDEWEWADGYPYIETRVKSACRLIYSDMDATSMMNRDDDGILVTQTLFNSDEDYEYIMPGTLAPVCDTSYYDEDRIRDIRYLGITHATSLEVRNSEGAVLHTLTCDDGWHIGYYKRLDLLKMGGNFYLIFEEVNDDEDAQLVFFRIDREQASITRVENALPFSVRPTVANRGEQITIELGENTSATEIEVFNALGQSVKRVPVQAGQREVKLSVESNGMHLINARSSNSQATTKIIVR